MGPPEPPLRGGWVGEWVQTHRSFKQVTGCNQVFEQLRVSSFPQGALHAPSCAPSPALLPQTSLCSYAGLPSSWDFPLNRPQTAPWKVIGAVFWGPCLCGNFFLSQPWNDLCISFPRGRPLLTLSQIHYYCILTRWFRSSKVISHFWPIFPNHFALVLKKSCHVSFLFLYFYYLFCSPFSNLHPLFFTKEHVFGRSSLWFSPDDLCINIAKRQCKVIFLLLAGSRHILLSLFDAASAEEISPQLLAWENMQVAPSKFWDFHFLHEVEGFSSKLKPHIRIAKPFAQMKPRQMHDIGVGAGGGCSKAVQGAK